MQDCGGGFVKEPTFLRLLLQPLSRPVISVGVSLFGSQVSSSEVAVLGFSICRFAHRYCLLVLIEFFDMVSKLGLRSFELSRRACRLMGLCLDYDTFEEPEYTVPVVDDRRHHGTGDNAEKDKSSGKIEC